MQAGIAGEIVTTCAKALCINVYSEGRTQLVARRRIDESGTGLISQCDVSAHISGIESGCT